MSIWFDPNLTVEILNEKRAINMMAHLNMRYLEIGEDFLKGDMPVDHRTQQPLGILHGGASCVLAETLGSTAANMVLDREKFYAVGLEINANHIRSVREGRVIGTTTPIHLGRKTQVWDIRIENEEGKLTCSSRLTMAVLPV